MPPLRSKSGTECPTKINLGLAARGPTHSLRPHAINSRLYARRSAVYHSIAGVNRNGTNLNFSQSVQNLSRWTSCALHPRHFDDLIENRRILADAITCLALTAETRVQEATCKLK